MPRQRPDRLHPLVRLVIALAAVGVCFAWLFREWDRRVEKGFGPKPPPIVAPAGPATRGQ